MKSSMITAYSLLTPKLLKSIKLLAIILLALVFVKKIDTIPLQTSCTIWYT